MIWTWLARICSGSQRTANLYAAVQKDADGPPVDLRFLKRPKTGHDAQKAAVRSDVISFLSNLYESLAETLPDCKDETFDDILPENVAREKLTDAYSIELNRQADASDKSVTVPFSIKEPKKRKRRSVLRGVKLNMDRVGGDAPGQKEVRWLPPGSMKDTWEQYRMMSSLPKPASFPCFWRVSWQK